MAESESDETSSDVTSQVPQCGSGCFLPLLEEAPHPETERLKDQDVHTDMYIFININICIYIYIYMYLFIYLFIYLSIFISL